MRSYPERGFDYGTYLGPFIVNLRTNEGHSNPRSTLEEGFEDTQKSSGAKLLRTFCVRGFRDGERRSRTISARSKLAGIRSLSLEEHWVILVEYF